MFCIFNFPSGEISFDYTVCVPVSAPGNGQQSAAQMPSNSQQNRVLQQLQPGDLRLQQLHHQQQQQQQQHNIHHQQQVTAQQLQYMQQVMSGSGGQDQCAAGFGAY